MTLEKSLPSEYYLSDEIFEKERERIFSREWFCAGREDILPAAGSLKVLVRCFLSAPPTATTASS